MSGDWSWAHTDKISKDPDTHGSTFVPVILGSDKTTVSVATGQNDYYLLYASIGNIQNNVHCTHCGAVAEQAETQDFQNFRCQLFHSSLSFILKNLRPAMMKPEVAQFRDGHYQCVIYGLGPYIVDYEEQVLLACILQNWCAKCLSHHGNLDDISLCCSRSHTDALIEECNSGTLKPEYGLVGELMVEKNLLQTHGKKQANIMLDDIDRRIVAVPLFPGLHRFPQGHHFKQWTGDNSKALMKVYLPAIEGYVPVDVVPLLEFCYLVHRNVITEKSLSEIEDVLTHFYKLAASRVDFHVHGMLAGTCLSAVLTSLEGIKWAQSVHALANELDIPHLADLVSQFLAGQLYLDMDSTEVPDSLMDCPHFNRKIWVFNSAVLVFFALSDLSGIGGMKHEYIRASPKWRSGQTRFLR
ncbi:hypothetical protein BDR05DRAFT_978706 [Suillus weaverae]|nr:hypothetical protein BDR05DRAFT_978706 [Suillus weaverae]